jgi:hypothetical protein
MALIVRPAAAAEAVGELARQFAEYLGNLGDTTDFKLSTESYLRDGFGSKPLDADIVAALLARHVPQLAERLQQEFYVDEPMMLRAIDNQSSFNFIHLQTMVKIDVYVSWRSEFPRSQFARRIRANLSTETTLYAYLASPEDTVLAKLDWYRKGGCVSDRQWRDILGVLKVQATALDRAYLRDWVTRLNLTDLLRRALDDAGLQPEP